MKISATQLRWFRLRRSGLVDPFSSPEETASRLVGVQAQLMAAANLSFWNRTADCTAETLEDAQLVQRTLVRFWGQRNTVHMYRAEDWPFLHSAFTERASIMDERLKKSGLQDDFLRLVRRTEEELESGRQLTHKDIESAKLQEQQDKWVVSYVIFMQLVREGLVCHGPDRGTESTFVYRGQWLPDLDWSPPDQEEACAELALRYLSAYGPARARDLAFWYGTTIANAKRWIASAGEQCCTVVCRGNELSACLEDLDEIGETPPSADRWPVHLLYRFDPLLLATKNKDWLIDEEHYKKVWRPAAHVSAVLLVHGRIAGTWIYKRQTRNIRIQVTPFAELDQDIWSAVHARAAEVAGFLGLELGECEIASPG